MKKIFKYQLEIKDYQIVAIKRPALLLSIVEDDNEIFLYALMDDMEEDILVNIRIIETGKIIKDGIESYKFLGSVKLDNRVIHVFVDQSKDLNNNRVRKEEGISMVRIDDLIDINKKPEMIIA